MAGTCSVNYGSSCEQLQGLITMFANWTDFGADGSVGSVTAPFSVQEPRTTREPGSLYVVALDVVPFLYFGTYLQ